MEQYHGSEDKFKAHLLEEMKFLREELKVKNYYRKLFFLSNQLNHYDY